MLLSLATVARSEIIGAEFVVVLPQFEDRKGVAFQGALFSALPKAHGVLENGIFLKPGTGSDLPGHAQTSFGYQLGYTFIPDLPLIRPGFFGGICYDKWVLDDGPTWVIHPNYGVKMQVSILSLVLSGRGLGFGLNFKL